MWILIHVYKSDNQTGPVGNSRVEKCCWGLGKSSEEDSDPETSSEGQRLQNKWNVGYYHDSRLTNRSGQFGNQRVGNAVGTRETVGGPVVQQSGIQCFNCKEFGHYAKECRKP
ncbi:retrovirus-related pol polyprotein from transposon TNT 1-94 [Tanacetum coccineum]